MEKFFKCLIFPVTPTLYNPRQLFQNDIVSVDNIYILAIATSHELFVQNMKTKLNINESSCNCKHWKITIMTNFDMSIKMNVFKLAGNLNEQ